MKKLTSSHYCVRATKSHIQKFKTAEIIFLGHRVLERQTGGPYKPCDVTPFNVFHSSIIS